MQLFYYWVGYYFKDGEWRLCGGELLEASTLEHARELLWKLYYALPDQHRFFRESIHCGQKD